jgi:hypothetical protein
MACAVPKGTQDVFSSTGDFRPRLQIVSSLRDCSKAGAANPIAYISETKQEWGQRINATDQRC